MLKSMTGYGRAQRQTPFGQMTAEIQSFNRKFLDLSFTLPKEFTQFELELRKLVVAQAERGQIQVRVYMYFDKDAPIKVVPNIALAKQVQESYNSIAEELGLSDRCTLSLLAKEDLLIYEGVSKASEEMIRNLLQEVVEAGLKEWSELRMREGQTLTTEILQRINNLTQIVDEIAKYSTTATKRYRDRLIKNLQEFLPNTLEEDERILREIALFADKVDITEEITRLKSHFKQTIEIINRPKSAGKTLEFILQEMLREFNTIGAKTSEIEVSRFVVEGKSEIERLREQLQNIE